MSEQHRCPPPIPACSCKVSFSLPYSLRRATFPDPRVGEFTSLFPNELTQLLVIVLPWIFDLKKKVLPIHIDPRIK